MCHRTCNAAGGTRLATSGDTLVEVIVAFTVFALISVGAIAVMNRGINVTDRSLEITLVREQIDAQASIIRYAAQTKSDAWKDITDPANLGNASDAATEYTECPDASHLPNGAFITTVSSTGEVEYSRVRGDTSAFIPAATYSNFTFRSASGTPRANGIWVIPVAVEGSNGRTFDMHIRACWQPIGSTQPLTLATIVRLYDAPEVVVATPSSPPETCNSLESYSNNLILNGDFSILAGNGPGVAPVARFSSDLPNRGGDVYPDDRGDNGTTPVYTGGFSLQHGNKSYGPVGFPNTLIGTTFPGDPSRGVPAINTWFYSNPNQRVDQAPGTQATFSGVLWSQEVHGLDPNTKYDFTGYFNNLLLPTSTAATDPEIQLRADGDPLMAPVTIERNPGGWRPVSLVFTTGPSQTTVTLDIYDYANDISGDDFGMTGLALRRCT